MRTMCKIIAFVLLALGIAGECHSQELFKPGSTYLAGQEVQDVYGTVWRVMRRVGIAVSPPSQGIYYSYVRVKEPAMVTANGYNVLDYGISPANGPEVNSLAWESFLTLIPEQATPSIYFPFGEYRFARPLLLYKRPVFLHGDNGTIFGNSTKLFFPYNSDGIKIDRAGASIQETIIEKICLIGAGGDGSKGNGIYTNSRIKLRDVTTGRFSQNGVLIYANINEGGEASGSIVESCHSLENGHDGFFAGRVDANAITFINCDARDNGRYGFNDDSFLGNYYISNMAHNNKAGHYYVRDKGNARSSFISCYGEMGSPVNQFSPKTTVSGGFLANGYTLDGTNIIYQ